jgi:hypothetical protein
VAFLFCAANPNNAVSLQSQTIVTSTVEKTHVTKKAKLRQFSFVALWIVFSAFCSVTGWALSAFGQLNPKGYAVSFLAGFAALIIWHKKYRVWFLPPFNIQRLRRRFSRFFPKAFLLLSSCAILGGVLYAPNNYDALAYRVPRVLHWLAESHWHWIHTDFHRLNTRGCAVEWISAPIIAFTNSDRWLFLINAFCFLMMPGLIFSVFTQLGVQRRVACVWMWLLPTGYCYLLQAGGIGNDLFGSVFVLAAMHFALRAAALRAIEPAVLAIFSVALATSAKTSNLPLLLPITVALLPCALQLARKPVVLAFVIIVALLVSFLPSAILNARYCGDWTGAKAENFTLMQGSRVLRVVNNVWLLAIQNYSPPIFPLAERWNNAVREHMPKKLHEKLKESFIEAGAWEWSLEKLQWEVNAGLGAGVSMLLFAGFLAKKRRCVRRLSLYQIFVLGSFGIAFLVYLVCMGLSALARETAPYYPILICICLLPSCHAAVIRRGWWKALAVCAFLLALLTLCITPPRPLWPAETILNRIVRSGKASASVAFVAETYRVNRARPDAFAPLRAVIPPGEKVVGIVTKDDPETSMWRPFGSRKVAHVLPSDSGDDLRRWGIKYIAINPMTFRQKFEMPLDQWLADVNGEVVTNIPLTLKASLGQHEWPIVALKPSHP